jgi:AcrR family transcriptional regulator
LHEALLAAATRTIAERGYQALRARDLANKVSCAVGAI